MDERGHERYVMLVQNAIEENTQLGILGRLYLDGNLAPIRSKLETQIIAVLRAAEIRYIPEPQEDESSRISPNALIHGDDIAQVLARGPEDNIRAMRDQIVERVISEDYIPFSDKIGRS